MREMGGSFFEENDEFHINKPLAQRGNLAGGFFAIWIPESRRSAVPRTTMPIPRFQCLQHTETLPPTMSTEYAQNYALASLGACTSLAAGSNGAFGSCARWPILNRAG